MNNTFSLEQISKTSNLDSNFILRQYKIDLMARFMEIKSFNPKLREDQIAKELGCSSSTLQRYRDDINRLSPYEIPPNSHKRRQKISNDNSDSEHDIEKRRMTSKDLKKPHKKLYIPTQMQTLPSTAQLIRIAN